MFTAPVSSCGVEIAHEQLDGVITEKKVFCADVLYLSEVCIWSAFTSSKSAWSIATASFLSLVTSVSV